jgi:hypothetical protein
MIHRRPHASEYDPRFESYMNLVPEESIRAALEHQHRETLSFAGQMPEPIVNYRYAPGKWTIREVIGHVLDTERILGFRLLTFARGDEHPLMRADEELYVRNGEFSRYPMKEWLKEYSWVRKSNIALIRHLPDEAWERTGTVSGLPISVRAIAYFMVGHERHHIRIIQTMYLIQS